MKREYHKWWSPALGRDMELIVFGHAGARVIAFPPRLGRFFEYEDRRVIESLREKIEAGWLQFYCVDSVDAESLYCDWKSPRARIERHLEFERYIIDEVLPFTALENPNPFLTSFGCSLGAFHAMNTVLRHPHRFGKVVAFSGRYDLTGAFPDFHNLFGGYYDDDIYFNNPSHYLPTLVDDALLMQLRHLEITLVVGEEDPFVDNTRELSRVLWDKGIWHALSIWSGRAHRFRDWREMVKIYF